MTKEEREHLSFSQEERERETIEEAMELIIEKVNTNDIDGVKGIIEAVYADAYIEGVGATWPWVWFNDKDKIEVPFGVGDSDSDYMAEEEAVSYFKKRLEEEIKCLIDREGHSDMMRACIKGFLAITHLRNRYTGDDFQLDDKWKLHRTKFN